MIVVDTNIIIYFYLPGEFSEAAQQALEMDAHWIAPHLWRSEMRNVLAGYIRRGQLKLETAHKIIQAAQAIFYQKEYEVNSAQVLSLAAGSGCSAYDCEFVALAQNFNILLITMDKQVLRAFPQVAMPLGRFVGHH
jgi:predicted nucleic acid-binding protein